MSTVRVWMRSTCCRPQTSTSRRRRLTMRPRSRARSASSATSRDVKLDRARARTPPCAPPDRRARRRTRTARAAAPRAARAPQQRLDARHQLGDRERLGHVVVGAAAEALEHVVLGAARGQHEDRLLGPLGAQLAADVEAAHARQHHVEQHQRVAARRAPRRSPSSPDVDAGRRVAVVREHVAEAGADRRLVLDDEDRGASSLIDVSVGGPRARVNGALRRRAAFTFLLPSVSSPRASHFTDSH